MKFFLLMMMTMYAISSNACKHNAVRSTPESTPSSFSEANVPSLPTDFYYSISRGLDSIKEKNSCGGYGYINIYVKVNDTGFGIHELKENEAGIQFEIVSSDIKNLSLEKYKKPLLANFGENGYLSYVFFWDDGRINEQEPVSLILNVYAVKSGKRSKACRVALTHPGGWNKKKMEVKVVTCTAK